MLWFYILLLVFAGITAPVWLHYGFKEKDHLVLGAGILQVGLAIIWILLIIISV